MNSILRTENFDSWIRKLKDKKGKARIVERIRDDVVYVLLGGGSKGSQKRDVANAQKLARSI